MASYWRGVASSETMLGIRLIQLVESTAGTCV
jgi:hypothetical protein